MSEKKDYSNWEKLLVSPEKALLGIEPGMSIFLGSGVAVPRTLLKQLLVSKNSNLQDLELIQLISFGDVISVKELKKQKYRLKTFSSGWHVDDAVGAGLVDLIPCRFAHIPGIIETEHIPIDAAFIQITPPNRAGYCSLGISVDVARQAMEQASYVVGEINTKIPRTYGDTFVSIDDFNCVVKSDEDPIYFEKQPVDNVYDKVADNIATIIEDGSCVMFYLGPLFDALGKKLSVKKNLSIHSPIFTDALMELVKSGAVTNRNKEYFQGKSLTSYAFGSPDLMEWLDRNPLVEFQSINKLYNPVRIGKNNQFVALIHAKRVDLTGRIIIFSGKDKITSDPAESIDFMNGATASEGGFNIIALSSRNPDGDPNICITVEEDPMQITARETVDLVVTEYGIASLKGRTVRERAQALIDIAHPDDRSELIDQAKERNLIYKDQIYIIESAHLYPAEIATKQQFKNNAKIRFRAIKPSDEEEMRHLFYRFSDKSIYTRYFAPIKVMPHKNMQKYVNVDYREVMSIVGLSGKLGEGKVVAEARYVKDPKSLFADIAFIVDETYQGLGIGSYLYEMLIRLAKERGLKGFVSDVLASNVEMMRVFENGGLPVEAKLEYGVYNLRIPF